MAASGAAVISALVSPKILGEDWSNVADEGETWTIQTAGSEVWATQTGNTRTWLNQ
jgi:hypothetical protein